MVVFITYDADEAAAYAQGNYPPIRKYQFYIGDIFVHKYQYIIRSIV